jgi:serine phosphatase RsbU (regulator of sigma subunit)
LTATNSLLVLATINLVLGGLVFLLGILILRENPRQRLNRVVSLMMFFGGFGALLTALSLLQGRAGTPAAAATAAAVTSGAKGTVQHFAYLWEFFFPSLFLFACLFPQERRFARRGRSRIWWLSWLPPFGVLVYLPHIVHFVLLFLLTLAGPWLQLRPASGVLQMVGPLLTVGRLFLELFLSVHQALFSLVNLVFGIGAVALLADSYGHTRVPRLRQQLRAIGIGLTACLVLYSMGSLIPTLFDLHLSAAARSGFTAAALTVGSGAIAYAIVRHKFLDAKLLARRGILYGTSTAAVVGFYLMVVVQVNRLLTTIAGVDARVIEPVFLVFALVAFQPTMSRLEELLDRVLLRDPADHRNVLRALGRDLQTTIELESLLTNSIRTIAESLILRRAYLMALPRDGLIVRVGAGETIPEQDLHQMRPILSRWPEDRSLRVSECLESMDDGERGLLNDRLRLALVIPLRWRGETVGGLLLGDKITGTEFTAEDVTLLTTLATQLSVSLQNALLVRDRVGVARLEEELRLARQIQRSFLVSEFPKTSRFEVHALNIPSKEVGGDLYDLVSTPDGGLVLAVADVAGKGVPAALLSGMLQASLRTQAASIPSVSEILRNINALVYRGTAVHQFATFFIARVRPDGRMSFSNAGHNYPVVARRDGGQVLLERGGLVLGVMEASDYEEDAIHLETGDRLVLYTDGITEAVNPEGELYGEDRLHAVIAGLSHELTAHQVADTILGALEVFRNGVEAKDDITLMVLRVLEPDPARLDLGQEQLVEQVSGAR